MTYNDINDDFFNEFSRIMQEENQANPQTHFTDIASDLAQSANELEQLNSPLAQNVDMILGDIVNIISGE